MRNECFEDLIVPFRAKQIYLNIYKSAEMLEDKCFSISIIYLLKLFKYRKDEGQNGP